MPKFTITYEDSTIKKELEFRADTFTLTMNPPSDGISVSTEKSFSYQYAEKYPEDEQLLEISEQLDLLSIGDEYEIQEALEALDELE